MANLEEIVPPMGTTDLTSWSTAFQKYLPGVDTEGYSQYKKGLPTNVRPITESEWVDQSFNSQLKDKHDQYKAGGGKLSLEDYSRGTSTNPIFATGSNDAAIQNNIVNSAMDSADAYSIKQGGGTFENDKSLVRSQADSGKMTIPGYTSSALGNVPELRVGQVSNNNSISNIKPGSPQDNGLNDLSSLDPDTGAVTNAKGDGIDIDPKIPKNILEKAAGLFEGVLDSQELKRMALYTVGGLMTGGSMGGSFKWAGIQVLNEKAATAKNNATLATAAGKMKPEQVKVSGKDKPVNAYWNAGKGSYIDAVTGDSLEGAVKFEIRHTASALRKEYEDLISGLETNKNNGLGEDDKKVTVGQSATVSYNTFRVKVKEWQELGYNVDLAEPETQAMFRIAVENALEANSSGKTINTPESFFDGIIIRAQNSSTAAGKQAFLTSEGQPIDVAANNSIVTNLKAALEIKQAKDPKITGPSLNAALFKTWRDMGQDKRDEFTNRAGDGASGFQVYLDELVKKSS